MKVQFVTLLAALTVSGGQCGFFSSPVDSPSNATSVSVPQPCKPENTLSPTLEYLRDRLPSRYAELITKNAGVFEDVGTLAGLATSAATGNPIAVVKLVRFLNSKDNPIPKLYTLYKDIGPLVNPTELSASSGTVAATLSP